MLANDAINRGSPVFINRLVDATGMLPSDIVKSYVMVRDGLNLPALYDAIDGLDNKVPGEIQNELYAGVGHVIQMVSRWALKTGINSEPLAPTVKAMRQAVDTLYAVLPSLVPGNMREETERWYERAVSHGVPKKLAKQLSQMPSLALIPEIMQIAGGARADLKKTAKTFFDVTELFRIGRMDLAAHQASVSDHYEALAIARSLDEISAARRQITRTALEKFGKEKEPVAAWHADDQTRIDRGQTRIGEMIEGGEINVARLTVAAGMLGDIARGRN